MKKYVKFFHMETFFLDSPDTQAYVIFMLDEMDNPSGTMVAYPGDWYIFIGDENDNLPVCLN